MKNKERDPHFKKLTVFKSLKLQMWVKQAAQCCTVFSKINKWEKILNNNSENNSYTEWSICV